MRALLVVLAACHVPEPAKPISINECDRTWEPNACLDAGHYYEGRDGQRAGEMFHHACMRRSVDGCIAGMKYNLALAEPACNMGYEPACIRAAGFLVETDEAKAIALVRRACAGSDRAACVTGVQLRFRQDEYVVEVGRLGCDKDLADSCFLAASNVEGDERRALLERGCKLKSPHACEALGQLLSKP
jgi:hypothetical protein